MVLLALLAIISIANAEEDKIEIDFQVAKSRIKEKTKSEPLETNWNQGRKPRT